MSALRILVTASALFATHVHAQAPGEITFWESVRDSKNPAELRAYLQRFPNGMFVPLAEARLAALEKAPAATPAPPRAEPAAPREQRVVAATAPANGYPSAGDKWSYRLTYPRLRGQWGQKAKPPSTHVVQASTVSNAEITDELSIDGGSSSTTRHGRGSYLVLEGVSLYSPYLPVFQALAPVQRLPAVDRFDAGCQNNYRCQASARVIGRETISVPAGRFETIKVVVEQQWTPFTAFSTVGSSSADMTGGRTLTVWYSPAVKRAVKYSSRLESGTVPPMDANFDLELVSYELK